MCWLKQLAFVIYNNNWAITLQCRNVFKANLGQCSSAEVVSVSHSCSAFLKELWCLAALICQDQHLVHCKDHSKSEVLVPGPSTYTQCLKSTFSSVWWSIIAQMVFCFRRERGAAPLPGSCCQWVRQVQGRTSRILQNGATEVLKCLKTKKSLELQWATALWRSWTSTLQSWEMTGKLSWETWPPGVDHWNNLLSRKLCI